MSVSATTKVNDVLRGHPRAGGDYAQRNDADVEALLHELNAMMDAGATSPKPRPSATGRPPEGPIGYTVA